MHRILRLGVFCAAFAAVAFAADARVLRLELTAVESPAFGGMAFGASGQYERITGIAHGELDPTDPANAGILDLALAPRGPDGKVAYATPFVILMPIAADRGNHILLYDVVNRGRPLAPGLYNRGGSASDIGDGFLERQGFSLVWSGWQGDLPPETPFAFPAPIAHAPGGGVITGPVRKDFELFAPRSTLDLGATDLGQGIAYPAADFSAPGAVLTERVHQADPPHLVAREDWALADCTKTPFPGTPSPTHLCRRGGFDTNHIYDFTYTARDPRVLGLGFAATRDLVAFLRRETADENGIVNPLAGRIRFTIAHGTSQSGRFLRSFLDLGFNAAPGGGRVFDGMVVHIAAVRLALNQRFAQPSAASMQHEEHLAPTQDFPFTWQQSRDALSGSRAGILDACTKTRTCPEIFQELSSLEYWNSRAALDTTDGAGHDLPLPAQVHLYHFAGTQHVLGLRAGPCDYAQNPNSYLEAMRALLLHLARLLEKNTPPPASRYPRVADNTLLEPGEVARIFPHIPGVAGNALINDMPVMLRGPGFDPRHESGILAEPPVAKSNARYDVRVPAVDGDGNETDGVRSVALQAPLGTYTGWNLRKAGFAEGDLCYLVGSFFPFARTRAEREANGDPRPSLEERYRDHAGYVAAVTAAIARQSEAGFLLPEDAARLRAEAEASDVLR
ncbi:MAG: alpha/beta hydrolase domain-containing protein [Acidibrevibacterium sp.]|uniref:alpha/beta hydrolase domain-containing protein n=1 Tax=Acidibrevibacterium sp. TaxID=2606776 RepID=UPI003CFF9C1C